MAEAVRRIDLAVESNDPGQKAEWDRCDTRVIRFEWRCGDGTPQGFACFTMTHAGLFEWRTHSIAVSASAMLLNDRSFSLQHPGSGDTRALGAGSIERACWCGFSP